MKKTLVAYGVATVAMMLAAASFAQEGGEAKTLPLAEARASIGEVVKDPAALTATMKKLSPADQVKFVAEVNAAIAKMPGSNEERAAVALNANKAALRGAAQGNMANVLAEVFATAPVESLGVISENFASDLFNRDADPSHPYTDAEYAAIAEAMVKKIAERTEASDDGGVRSAFGVMMMVNASNGSPEEKAALTDTLSNGLPENVREVAKTEWVPAATGDKKSYDEVLAYSTETTATQVPNADVVLQLAGPQMLDAMLSDVAAGVIASNGETATPILDQAFGGFGENVVNNGDPGAYISTPETVEPNKQPDEDEPWVPGYRDQEL